MTMFARRFALPALAAAMVATAAPALAQERAFEDAAAASRTRELEGRTPFAGLTQMQARTGNWSVNSFYALAASPGGTYSVGEAYYVMVRETGGPTAPEAVQWADSRHCPAMADALLAMESLPPVRVDTPWLGNEPDFLVTADGTHHVFWTQSATSGSGDTSVSLEIGGNVSSPVALWWSQTAERIKDCWSSAPPEGLIDRR